MFEVPCQLFMVPPHFLQAHDVGIKLLDRMCKVVNFKATLQTHAPNPFMDVVGGNAQRVHT
jgi:methylglyoxal synthase